MSLDSIPADKRYYSVVISRELHVYASSVDEAIERACSGERYAVAKVTVEIINAPADEATPL